MTADIQDNLSTTLSARLIPSQILVQVDSPCQNLIRNILDRDTMIAILAETIRYKVLHNNRQI